MTARVSTSFWLYPEGLEIFTPGAHALRKGFVLDMLDELVDVISPTDIETLVEEHERVITNGGPTSKVSVPLVEGVHPADFSSGLRRHDSIYVASAPMIR